MAISETDATEIARDAGPDLPREGRRYLLVGGSQALIAWGAFVLLTMKGLSVPLASVLGRVVAASAGFWFNGYYTFSLRHLNWRHGARYVLVWTLLTILSAILITLVADRMGLHAAWIAKPMVSALVACLGFFLWKYVVYRR